MNRCPLGARPARRTFPARNIGPATAPMPARNNRCRQTASGRSDPRAFIALVTPEEVKLTLQSRRRLPSMTITANCVGLPQSISIFAIATCATAAPK